MIWFRQTYLKKKPQTKTNQTKKTQQKTPTKMQGAEVSSTEDTAGLKRNGIEGIQKNGAAQSKGTAAPALVCSLLLICA